MKHLLPVGTNFEDLFGTFTKSAFNSDTIYTPYNIYESNGAEFIELAVTGLAKDDIKAYYEDGLLIIEGIYPEIEKSYHHKGLSQKDFKLKFQLAQNVEVKEIKVENGLCTISLAENKPETKYLNIH